MCNVQHYKAKHDCLFFKEMQLDVDSFAQKLEINNTNVHALRPSSTLIQEQQSSPEPNLLSEKWVQTHHG